MERQWWMVFSGSRLGTMLGDKVKPYASGKAGVVTSGHGI